MLTGSVIPVAADAPSFAGDFGILGLVFLVSITSGAIALPASRALGTARLFARRRRADPATVAASLIACASIARESKFNAEASSGQDPLLNRAIALAASDAAADEVWRELSADPPAAPRPVVAFAPVIGLLIALTGLGTVATAMAMELLVGPLAAGALVLALYAAFVLSAAASSVADRIDRLEPSDVLCRALIAAAVPAIRAGADPAAIERLLRPLLSPNADASPAGRLAA